MTRKSVATLVFLVPLLSVVVAGSAQAGDSSLVAPGAHYGLTGVITKIRSGMLFVSSRAGLQPRTISPMKADRVGLHQAQVGESVNLLVDSGNVLIDVSGGDRPIPEHRFIKGTLRYADPFWGEIQLSTPEGFSSFEVDALAGSKLSTLKEGLPVLVELDSDNVMIDIYKAR
jgi:hypothetical protein